MEYKSQVTNRRTLLPFPITHWPLLITHWCTYAFLIAALFSISFCSQKSLAQTNHPVSISVETASSQNKGATTKKLKTPAQLHWPDFGPQQKQQEQDKKKQEKSLEDQWVDYLIAPIDKATRKKIADRISDADKRKLDILSRKTKMKYDAVAAMVYLTRLCEMGPRVTGSVRFKVQVRALKKYFKKLDLKTIEQKFQTKVPSNRSVAEVVNLIVPIHPERKQRLIICCHYDTRPYADQDPVNPKAPLLGANDGASGVGFLMALAPHLKKLKGKVGIDLVFFDAEELVYDADHDPMFIGSTYFAKNYVVDVQQKRISYRYKAGVLVDMIADAHLELPKEGNSLQMARHITNGLWNKAAVLRVKEFQQKKGQFLRDDHLPLNQIAKIPTCDIIDFDYPKENHFESYWHTTKDTPDKCSAVSMAKVAHVVFSWSKGFLKR